jgi:hypothetical protein
MKKSNVAFIGIGVGILIIIGYFVYRQTGVVQYEQKRSKALESVQNELWDRIGTLEKNVADLEEELALRKEALVDDNKLTEVFGTSKPAPSPETSPRIDCNALEERIRAIFSYLDTREYLKQYEISDGTYALAKEITGKLAAAPPMITGEMRDMVSLARNVAHFYRVLGEARIDLIRDIMENESDVMESFMASWFPWVMACSQCKPDGFACPSLETLYQYAGFFLNTLAGKSYLMRRPAKLRILVSYYSVLILDKANQETLNPHGIDIRPFIDSIANEISNQRNLVFQMQYLKTLEPLRKRYAMAR